MVVGVDKSSVKCASGWTVVHDIQWEVVWVVEGGVSGERGCSGIGRVL